MGYKRMIAVIAASAAAMAVASAASATTFPIGSPNFFITAGTPFTSSITAVFFNTPAAGGFDDSFTFTIPTQSGVGSGSISTSFSGDPSTLTITQLLINEVPYAVTASASGYSAVVGGVPITQGVLNTIRVVGTATGSGSYAGTATFTANTAVVPEAATWAMMVGGFGMIGAALRTRRRVNVSFG